MRKVADLPGQFPTRAAMNPSPCGYYDDPVKPCTCSNMVVTKYQKRISGPLLDRIDTHIEVPRVEYEKLSDSRFGESSAAAQVRVEAARSLHRVRFGDADGITSNADMRPAEVRRFSTLYETGKNLMKSVMNQLQLSARAYHPVLKLARTETIPMTHLSDALQYRPHLSMM